MFELNKTFSINDVIIDRNVEDKDFSIVELWALSEGNNSHGNPISREVLERDANTFKGKFIIGKYDKWTDDVQGHEIEENIFGYVSLTEEPQFKTKMVEGVEKEFVVVQGVLSKIYAKEIVDLFKVNKAKSVSCEFSCSLMYDEDEYGRPIDECGNSMNIENPILGYSISGITILGENIKPSVKGAEIVMKRFSEDTNKIEASKEETMEENKEFSEQPKDEDIVMEEPNQQEIDDTEAAKGDAEVDEVKEESVEMAENETEEMSEEPKAEEEKEMGCDKAEEMSCKEESCDKVEEESCGDKKMSEVEEQPIQVQEEKSFAEQAKEFAEEDYKDFVQKLFSAELQEMVESVVELKKFMETTVKANTEKRFSEIMVEPKLCLGEKAYNVLFEEGSKLSLNELEAFEQKVKAFCEGAPKKQETDDEVLMFSCGNTETNINTELSVEELIKKYN